VSNEFTPTAPLQTAVLFLVFNRPDTTAQVFEAIRKAKPPGLYVAADGPRTNREGEAERVARVREIATAVDWPCEVKTLFREENLGCKYAVSGGITWFFEQEEQGIILEDDCLPSQSFFWFCESLLNRYQNDKRIWHISGASTLVEKDLVNNESYYFSKYNHIWGWASWADRWKEYDVDISMLPNFQSHKYIKNINFNYYLRDFWLTNFSGVKKGMVDTWDYQWYFTTWVNGGLSIIPTRNMISNIGFGADATHTSDSSNGLANQMRIEIDLRLVHPRIIMPNVIFEDINSKNLFNINIFRYLGMKVKKRLKLLSRRVK
jgi:hypothetical protein